MKRVRLALGAAALAVLVAAAVASAATSSGSTIRIFVSGSGSVHQKILIVGAIGDYGTGTSIDPNGKADPNGSFERLSLKKGTITVDATKFNAVSNSAKPTVNSAKTCSLMVTWSGPATIVSGTGAYKKLTGSLKLTGTFAGISPRFESGPHKGQCENGNTVQPTVLYLSVVGVGKVKIG